MGVFLFLYLHFWDGLAVNLELPNLARLAAQQALGIPLSLVFPALGL